MRPHLDELRRSVVPVVIGSGAPPFAKEFQAKMDVPDLPIFSDEERVSFRAAGMRGRQSLLNLPRTIARGIATFIKHPQGKTMGDPFQLGGVVIVRPDGNVSYRFASEWAGQHPPIPTLLAEAAKAAR